MIDPPVIEEAEMALQLTEANEGALGSIGSLFRTSAAIKRGIDVVKELTNRNFAVNHIPPTLDADAFRYTSCAALRHIVRSWGSRGSCSAGPRRRLESDDPDHDGCTSDRSS
jgi:hypothetical protein